MSADAHGNFTGKRLVVFGCGYVGTAVAREAITRGMKVTALTRNAAKAAALEADGIETVVADLAGRDWHAHVTGEADFLLNCVSSGGGGIEGYQRSYVEGMRSVLEWARELGAPGTLVYTSSTSVYPQDGGARVDETAPTESVSERAGVLLAAERSLRESGVCHRWFILRLAGIYGPGRHQLLEQVRAGEVAGRAEIHLNLIHRDDICAAVWAAFTAAPKVANETFNVADDGAAPKGDVVVWLADQLRVPVPTFTGARAEGRRAVTPNRIISKERIKRQLGWRPGFPTFREGYGKILSR